MDERQDKNELITKILVANDDHMLMIKINMQVVPGGFSSLNLSNRGFCPITCSVFAQVLTA